MVCFLDLSYKQYKPSKLACAIVAAVRTLVGLEPVWPARLQNATRNTECMFTKPYESILK